MRKIFANFSKYEVSLFMVLRCRCCLRRLSLALCSADHLTALPPACSIFSCADFENLWACTVIGAS